MQVINMRLLSQILAKTPNYARIMNSIKEINEACHFQLKFMKPEAIINTAHKINLRQSCCKDIKGKVSKIDQCSSWGFGQFKVFVWVLLYLCEAYGIQLQNVDERIIKKIISVFPLKDPYFIRYQTRLLVSFKDPHMRPWNKSETQMLQEYLKKYSDTDNINWRLISFKLFTESESKYFRTLNHCRERWNNHLNPHVKKGDWTIEEDIRLFELISEYGLKWSKISKSMGHKRTEHMVKNRYNRFLRIWNISKNASQQLISQVVFDKIAEYYKMRGKEYKEKSQDNVKIEEQSLNQHQNTNKSVPSQQDEALPLTEVVKQECLQNQNAIAFKTILVLPEVSKEQLRMAVKESDNYYYPFFDSYFPSLPFFSTLHTLSTAQLI